MFFKGSLFRFASLILLFSLVGAVAVAQDVEPLVLQDFEGEVTLEDIYQAVATVEDGALASTSSEGEWHTVGASFSGAPVDVSAYGEICFDMNDTTAGDNTVGVKFFDAAGTSVERWTDHEGVGTNPRTVSGEWVTMCLNLSTFTDLDLTALTKVEFAMFAAGVYYFDNIVAQAESGEPEAVATEEAAEMGELTLTVIQDFEGEGAADLIYSNFQADVSIGDVAVNGVGSLMAASAEGEWHAFGAFPTEHPVDASGYDVLCFSVYDTTALNNGLADNTVGVRLFDGRLIDQEVWTDHVGAGDSPKTVTNEWVQMCVNLSVYIDLDLTQLDKIQFAMFHPGTYYIDDIALGTYGPAVRTGDVIQDFEGEGAADLIYSNFQADVSIGDIAYSGEGSLMASGTEGEWHAFGAFPTEHPVDASGYEAICFWIYDTTALNNGLADNTVGVRLFDGRLIDQEVWTDHVGAGDSPKSVTNEWVQMCVNLSVYVDLDLTQLDKIQFAMFHPGVYYVDDITLVPAAGE